MDVTFADLLVGSPRTNGAGRIDRIGAQHGGVGERDDEVSVRPEYSVDLAEHAIEVVDER